MAFTDTLITIIVLLGLFLLGYCGITGRSLKEVFKEIWDLLRGK